ncbi:MBL fold metallo-hydrolase [Telmatospirillum sp.]|uniref:MBL fold metallo-hydrolase n=1 Tax=Telmatospirillum sp. TaxID=2079197 RepID=UPI0028515649|nr:MBL fold metallo-hydrolase [Telmatospirillum sp.]MDR3439332.1 MBL fold metallo-hydrolase [Telmatospirillum sp.]
MIRSEDFSPPARPPSFEPRTASDLFEAKAKAHSGSPTALGQGKVIPLSANQDISMIEELGPSLYRIEVPLPESPLKSLNCVFIRGEGLTGRHLLVDNGFNRPECLDSLMTDLRALDVELGRTDFFITHLHADHCGLTADLQVNRDAKVWCSRGDGIYINTLSKDSPRWHEYLSSMACHGLNQQQLNELHDTHPGIIYAIARPIPFTPVRDGDVLEYGPYRLRVCSVPGHTPDQLCLFEPDRHLLFSSDHILGDITPNIQQWPGVEDSLGHYLRSLEKTLTMDADLCVPGHRSMITNVKSRIREIQAHHASRLIDVRRILKEGGPQNAYTVASRMTWSIRAKSWNDFPLPQKWFASGEALAHLEHLAARGEVTTTRRDKQILFQTTRA